MRRRARSHRVSASSSPSPGRWRHAPRCCASTSPAPGSTRAESIAFGGHLREIVDRGTPILLIDHDMGLVLGISDRVVVLEFGKVIAVGTPSDVRADSKVVAAYLGSAAHEMETLTDG